MILFVFVLFLVSAESTVKEFDNSILGQKPYNLTECQALPDDCNVTEDSCLTCNASGICTINIFVILPADDSFIVNLDAAKRVLYEAKDDYKISDNILLKIQFYDDGCTQEKASGGIVSALKHMTCVDVIFGPICEYNLATVGRAIKYIPSALITPGGFSVEFSSPKTQFSNEMYLMINSGQVDFRSYGEFMHMVLERFGWKKVVLAYEKADMQSIGGEDVCYLCMRNIVNEIRLIKNLDYVDGDLQTLGENYTEFLINKVGVDYSIILTCANKTNIRKLLIEAAKLKMMDRGEYMFFNFEFFNDAEEPLKPWFSSEDKINNEFAKKGFEAVYTIMPYSETDFEKFNQQKERGSIFLDSLYDGMAMYLQALNNTLDQDELGNYKKQSILGCQSVYAMMGKTFQGRYNTTIQMNCNGLRTAKYALVKTNSDGYYNRVATYSTVDKTIDSWEVVWPNGVPPDTPTCGYDLSKCPVYDVVKILSMCLIAVIVVGMTVVGFFIYRQIKLRSEIEAKAWKVAYKDIAFPSVKRRGSLASMASMLRVDMDGLSMMGDKQLYVTVGFYNSINVAVKYLKDVKIELNSSQLFELKVMKDLSNNNLVKFYGACLDIPNCILTEYCSKGSLQDILEDDRFRLDTMFRISLIMDLVRGMHYLHRSPIKVHGALKSTNCLVDSRFVLKISDFGLKFLRVHSEEDIFDVESHSHWERQLWTAPELLRESFPPTGTQKGDVYSFGIIMHEIIVKKGVFYVGDDINWGTKRFLEKYNRAEYKFISEHCQRLCLRVGYTETV